MHFSIRSHKFAVALLGCLLLVAGSQRVDAAIMTSVEPDDYAVGTDLNTIVPGVVLGIYNTNLGALENPLSADIESLGDLHTSTGDRIFGFNDFPFLSSGRHLHIEFDELSDFVSLDFIGPSEIGDVIGIFEAYNAAGVLLATYTTGGLGLDEVETMSFTRVSPDVKFARAYSSANGLPFGRMDNLNFNKFVAIPEPTTLCLVGLMAAVVCSAQRFRK